MRITTKWLWLPAALCFSAAVSAQAGARPGTPVDTDTPSSAGTGFLPNAVIAQAFASVATAPNAAVGGVCALNQPAMAGWFGRNNAAPTGTTCIFNPSTAGLGPPFPAQDGGAISYAALNFNASTGTNPISTWLVSPRVNFGTGASLSFWFRSANTAAGDIFADRIQVRLSTAADAGTPDVGTAVTDVGTFTSLLVDINPTLSSAFVTCPASGFSIGAPNGTIAGTVDGAWCQVTITQAAGIPTSGSGRIAFRHFVPGSAGPDGDNSNFIGIDTFSFDEGVSGTPGLTLVKRVQTSSNAANCPTATASITVPTGTQVYYCYQATNTGTLTLQTHNLTDTAFATPVLTSLQFTLAATASSPWVVSPAVTVTGSTSSAASWTACTQATSCAGAPAGTTAAATVAAGAVTAGLQQAAQAVTTLGRPALILLALLVLGVAVVVIRRH